STLTVTARDDRGNVLPGVTVEFLAFGNGVNVTQPTGTTDSNGIATGALSSTATGFKNVSATLDGTPMVQTALVIVVPPGGGEDDDDDDDDD
ncbi:MAG: Ig-like domain-containing protein, partial [Gemmatimonadales bacterium]